MLLRECTVLYANVISTKFHGAARLFSIFPVSLCGVLKPEMQQLQTVTLPVLSIELER